MFQPVFVENPDGPPFLLPVFLGTHVVVVPDVAHDELQVLQHALLAHGARVVARLHDVVLDVVSHPLARLPGVFCSVGSSLVIFCGLTSYNH